LSAPDPAREARPSILLLHSPLALKTFHNLLILLFFLTLLAHRLVTTLNRDDDRHESCKADARGIQDRPSSCSSLPRGGHEEAGPGYNSGTLAAKDPSRR
jgi:hypothetical protein